MNATRFYVGTASWQEPDFISHWYPKGLPKTRLLEHYAEHFSFVEIDSTFYGLPQPKTVEAWCRQTPDDFVFTVKLHRLLSRHATEPKFLPPDIRARATLRRGRVELTLDIETRMARAFRAAIQPLIDAGKLGALLLQLSPSFAPESHELAELENVIDIFGDFPLAVEFRHRGWLTGEQADRTLEFCQRERVCLSSVDAPDGEHSSLMPNVDFMTTPKLGYLRAHGRDARAYLTGRTVQSRFNYDYADDELADIAQRLTGFVDKVQAVFAVFNNNRHHFAPDAAERLQEILARWLSLHP